VRKKELRAKGENRRLYGRKRTNLDNAGECVGCHGKKPQKKNGQKLPSFSEKMTGGKKPKSVAELHKRHLRKKEIPLEEFEGDALEGKNEGRLQRGLYWKGIKSDTLEKGLKNPLEDVWRNMCLHSRTRKKMGFII